eukprot:GHUV01028985.1.p1 GENE.GHUV01028985.1~~GHUV01028985.1.p1  ORF type:complete len:151 (-),score=22.10 GHUV01028985.1:638-1090(-)
MSGHMQVGEIEAAEKDKMREKCEKIISHGINCFINRQLIYNFPEEIFADAGGVAAVRVLIGYVCVETIQCSRAAPLPCFTSVQQSPRFTTCSTLLCKMTTTATTHPKHTSAQWTGWILYISLPVGLALHVVMVPAVPAPCFTGIRLCRYY